MKSKELLEKLEKVNDFTENIVASAVLKTALGIPLKSKSKARSFYAAEILCRQEALFSEQRFGHVDAMIKYSKTFNQAMRAYEEALPGSNQRRNAFVKALSLIDDVSDIEPAQRIVNNEDLTLREKTELINALNELEGTVVTFLIERSHTTEMLLEHYEIVSKNSPARLRIVKAFCSIAFPYEMKSLLEDITSATDQNVNEIGALVDGILTLVEYHNTLLSQPIESIDDMPEDVLKILKKAKFKNLEELVDYSEYWLLNNDLIGKRNIKKVNQFLKAKRLMLRDFTPAES